MWIVDFWKHFAQLISCLLKHFKNLIAVSKLYICRLCLSKTVECRWFTDACRQRESQLSRHIKFDMWWKWRKSINRNGKRTNCQYRIVHTANHNKCIATSYTSVWYQLLFMLYIKPIIPVIEATRISTQYNG